MRGVSGATSLRLLSRPRHAWPTFVSTALDRLPHEIQSRRRLRHSEPRCLACGVGRRIAPPGLSGVNQEGLRAVGRPRPWRPTQLFPQGQGRLRPYQVRPAAHRPSCSSVAHRCHSVVSQGPAATPSAHSWRTSRILRTTVSTAISLPRSLSVMGGMSSQSTVVGRTTSLPMRATRLTQV